ncbi:hypothetical protein DAY19_06125 [Halobacteriovorax vibrionivorans]|uniref:Uncharacterized protein n=1 Tax=Halobacteriovorax vibrionivorans TaxID=2152716 RepID=A0ABY0IE76_9BACT|nr:MULTISPECIES: hypothetical protein [Halobacteriovorax]RZF21257.1 hypothetical protein DAY19_06125 [Halobacteriovorax vibrionivorans]TGD47985.1 hypothetical protein EP118_06005 [Halobacteriovorax sp. Y22]
MKKIIAKALIIATICTTALTSSVFAGFCADELLFDPSWPQNKISNVLQCERVKAKSYQLEENLLLGQTACFGIIKNQYADFKNTTYKVSFWNTQKDYEGLSIIPTILENGRMFEKAKVVVSNDGQTHLSFRDSGRGYTTEVGFNMDSPSTMKVHVFNKKLFSKKSIETAEYECSFE